jgi:hypothetical protein
VWPAAIAEAVTKNAKTSASFFMKPSILFVDCGETIRGGLSSIHPAEERSGHELG